MGGTNTKRPGAFGSAMGNGAMRAASMAANAGRVSTPNWADFSGRSSASNPANSTADSLGNSPINARGGQGGYFSSPPSTPSSTNPGNASPVWNTGNWTYQNGNYISPSGSSYSYNKDTGWASNNGLTGATRFGMTPAETYKQQQQAAGNWGTRQAVDPNSPISQFMDWRRANPSPAYTSSWRDPATGNTVTNQDVWRQQNAEQRQNVFNNIGDYYAQRAEGQPGRNPNFVDKTANWGLYGLNPTNMRQDLGLGLQAWRQAASTRPEDAYNATVYADQFGRNAFNDAGYALMSNGYYKNEMDKQQRIASGVELIGPLERISQQLNRAEASGNAGNLANAQNNYDRWLERIQQKYVPTEQGGWMKAPDAFSNDAQALERAGLQANSAATRQANLARMAGPQIAAQPNTSGLLSTPFAGGFTTAPFTGPPQAAPLLNRMIGG